MTLWAPALIGFEVVEGLLAVEALVQCLARRGTELRGDDRVRGAAFRAGPRFGGVAARELGPALVLPGLVRWRDAVGAQLFLGRVAHPVGGPGWRELRDHPRLDAGLCQA